MMTTWEKIWEFGRLYFFITIANIIGFFLLFSFAGGRIIFRQFGVVNPLLDLALLYILIPGVFLDGGFGLYYNGLGVLLMVNPFVHSFAITAIIYTYLKAKKKYYDLYLKPTYKHIALSRLNY